MVAYREVFAYLLYYSRINVTITRNNIYSTKKKIWMPRLLNWNCTKEVLQQYVLH